MSEIESTSYAKGKIALQKGGSIKDVQEALKFHPDVSVRESEPKEANRVELTYEAQEAINSLPEVFNSVDPDVPRLLTEEERADLLEERNTILALKDELLAREERIKEIYRNHQDRQAESEGRVGKDTPVDSRGHYVIAKPGDTYRTEIPGHDLEVSQEYRSGRVSVDPTALEDLAETDRETYLGFTRSVRVFDEDKALKHLNKNPESMSAVTKITQRGTPHTALFFRKPKKK